MYARVSSGVAVAKAAILADAVALVAVTLKVYGAVGEAGHGTPGGGEVQVNPPGAEVTGTRSPAKPPLSAGAVQTRPTGSGRRVTEGGLARGPGDERRCGRRRRPVPLALMAAMVKV